MPRRSSVRTTQQVLPLDLRPSGRYDLAPAPRIPDHRFADDDGFGHVTTPSRDLPPVPAWAARILLVVAEVLDGRRGAEQLARWTSHETLAGLRARCSPMRAEAQSSRIRPRRVRTLRWSEPADGAVELTAVLDGGDRPLVLCARFEGYDGRWLCVALGSPDGWAAGEPTPDPAGAAAAPLAATRPQAA
jgi:hypothetical protein